MSDAHLFTDYVRVRAIPEVPEHPPVRSLFPGAYLRSLPVHADPRGDLFEVWRASWWGSSTEVQQAYLSSTDPDVVKGWHCHAKQTDRFVCVQGRVIVGLFDTDSRTVVEVVLRADLRQTLTIGPTIPHGWYNPGPERATILNLVSHEYDGTDEYRRPAAGGPVRGFDYEWRRRRDG